MKQKPSFYLTVLFFILLSSAGCRKHKPINPVDQLPPATQIGANTFGCLISGQTFLPKGPSLSPILQCAYQYLNSDYSKGFFFQLSASDKSNSSDVTSIGVYTDSLEIGKMNLQLGTSKPGNAYGFYHRINLSGIHMNLYTNNNLPGKLIITKFDEINQIVSGTFAFSVVNNTGDTIKVTDGRFDMQFTN